MKLLTPLLFALACSLACAPAAGAADENRFSKSLTADESTAIGLAALNSDQVAILDALVRHDLSRWDYVSKTPRADRFSARLTAEERHNAGVDAMSDPQLIQLDAAVQRLEPTAPRGAYAASVRTNGAIVPWLKVNRSPEIHGSISLMVGAGSGGYTEYGGAMVLTYDDPARGFGLAVGYAETHSKGGYARCGYDYWDRYNRYGRFGLPGDPWW